jgi:hypothetical protein
MLHYRIRDSSVDENRGLERGEGGEKQILKVSKQIKAKAKHAAKKKASKQRFLHTVQISMYNLLNIVDSKNAL